MCSTVGLYQCFKFIFNSEFVQNNFVIQKLITRKMVDTSNEESLSVDPYNCNISNTKDVLIIGLAEYLDPAVGSCYKWAQMLCEQLQGICERVRHFVYNKKIKIKQKDSL